jgi:group I intron endonuclease
MEKTYSVYCHTNRIDGKKYVGITSQRAHGRWKFGEGYKSNRDFYADIQKIGWDAFDHTILAENVSREEAEKLEIYYIDLFDSRNPEKGYNRRPGGESHADVKAETGIKIGNALRGRTTPKEVLEKRSRTMQGHFVSEETRKKIGLKHKGKVASPELHQKLKDAHQEEAFRVEQISASRDVICSFPSIREASRQTGINRSLIKKVCLGKQTSTKGTFWRFSRDGGD